MPGTVRLIAGMPNGRKRLFASSGLVSRLLSSRIDEKAAWHEVKRWVEVQKCRRANGPNPNLDVAGN